MKPRILVTGAAGTIAHCILPRLAEHYALRLLDRNEIVADRAAEIIKADIADFGAVRRACEGADTVIHLAAEASMHASFDELLQPNLVGVYNVFEAALQADCSRVIFASSINAVLGYPPNCSTTCDTPVNPVNIYGATKCFGEALARAYANRGLSSLCLRIGALHRIGTDAPRLPDDPYFQGWISDRDLATLILLCVRKKQLDFAILHAQSRHANPRLSIEHTRRLLGYEPQDGTI